MRVGFTFMALVEEFGEPCFHFGHFLLEPSDRSGFLRGNFLQGRRFLRCWFVLSRRRHQENEGQEQRAKFHHDPESRMNVISSKYYAPQESSTFGII